MLRTKLFCRFLCLALACLILGGCALGPGSGSSEYYTDETGWTDGPDESAEPTPPPAPLSAPLPTATPRTSPPGAATMAPWIPIP